MSELEDAPSEGETIKAVNPDDKIRLVRLFTGEDILCVMREDIEKGDWEPTDTIILSTPLKLVMHRTQPLRPASAMAIGILQWLPDELLDCHAVVVKIGHIITVMEPKQELKDYYKKTVDAIQTHIIIGDKMIRNDITKASHDAGQPPQAAPPVVVVNPKQNKSLMETINENRMQELMQRMNELDDYLMLYEGEDDGPITFH